MSATLNLIRVSPIGHHDGAAFVERAGGRGGLSRYQAPIYPPSPRGHKFSELRRRNQINMREAARLLGVRCSELSGLEAGSFTLSDEDWAKVMKLIDLEDHEKPKPSAATLPSVEKIRELFRPQGSRRSPEARSPRRRI